jgi:hypothetical protein
LDDARQPVPKDFVVRSTSAGAEGGIGDYVPKPKWMRWRTYDRKLEEIFAAEEVVDAHLLGFVQKLERRPGR